MLAAAETRAAALKLAQERYDASISEMRAQLAAQQAAIEAALAAPAAPAAPAGWYWSSTVRIDSEAVNPYAYRNVQKGATETHADRLVPQVGWAVDARTGEARSDMPRRERLPLRLVRSLK